MTFDLSKASFGSTGFSARGTMVQATEFYDFGAPVQVTPPPDSEVADLSELIAALPTPPG
jgi:hypothetical protein